jgi:hypothetical protein
MTNEEYVRLFRHSFPVVSPYSAVQARYLDMRIDGQSHQIAEVLALRKFPGCHGTSATFMQGTHCQDSPLDAARYAAAAAQGVDTNGRRYISGMARFPNDPEAWISGCDDVVRLCRDRNWNCYGAVQHEATEPTEPAPEVAIAPEIVNQHVAACLGAFPAAEHTPQLKADIAERVTQELTGEIDLDEGLKVTDYEYADAVAISEQRD